MSSTEGSTSSVADRVLADRPSFHRGAEGEERVWNALGETLHTIARLVRPGDVTVETGCGASTVVFAATGANHTSISFDDYEHRRVVQYCEKIGVDHGNVSFVADMSDRALPSVAGGAHFDAVFIDGGHSFPYPIVDWHYMAGALNTGGHLIMDDVPIPAVRVVHDHMISDPAWEFLGMCDQRTGLYRKVATDPDPQLLWRSQRFNARYPDYSFAPLPERARLELEWQARRARQWAASEFPAARDAYRRLRSKS